MIEIIVPTNEHIDQIRKLNDKSLITHLSHKQKKDGFIRIEYSMDDLHKIIDNREIVVATEQNKLIGYYLIGRQSGAAALHYQRIKANNLTKIPFHKIGYGCQVCIEREYRKNGLFKAMLDKLTLANRDKYSHLLCSVSESNIASFKTHIFNDWRLLDIKDTMQFLIYSTNK